MTMRSLPATLAALILGGGALLAAIEASATTIFWNNPAGGDWSVPTNWNPASVPGAADIAVIAIAGTYTVTLDVNTSLAELNLGAASGSQKLFAASRTITVGGPLAIGANGILHLSNSSIGGTGTLTVGGSLLLQAGTLNTGVDNAGLISVQGSSSFGGALSTQPGSTLQVRPNGGYGVTLTVANGFANNGIIELDSPDTYAVSLVVTNGTLTNMPGATIRALPGPGSAYLTAALDNQGTVTVERPLTMGRASSTHANSGTINLSAGDLTVTQSGTNPALTNTGAVTIGAARTLTITGGTFRQDAGVFGGSGALSLSNVTAFFNTSFLVSALTLTGTVATLTSDLSTAAIALTVVSSTIDGPGHVINAAGQSIVLNGGTINAAVENSGLISVQGSSSFGGALSTQPGSTLQVRPNGGYGVTLTVANGFANNGIIELDSPDTYAVSLVVTNGTLTNMPGATIRALPGPGSAYLTAALDNQGTVTVERPLTMGRASSTHANSGTINLSAGDLTVTQSGTNPALTNTGAVTIGAARTLTITGGTFRQDAGVFGGSGALSLSNVTAFFNTSFLVSALTLTGTVATLTSDLSTAATALTVVSSTIDGPGHVINAAGQDIVLQSDIINAPMDNAGLISVQGTTSINGPLTTTPSSTIEVVASQNFSVTLTVANGFVNNGTITLTGTNTYASILSVTSGTLINAVDATILALAGGGGTRHINSQLANNGRITVSQALHIGRALAQHANAGLIDVQFSSPATIIGSTLLNAAGGEIRTRSPLSLTCAVTNAGTITPLQPGGSIGITGDYSQTAIGTLAFEVSPESGSAVVSVTGLASLGGTLRVTLVAGFVPVAGDSFAVVAYAGKSGEFGIIMGPQSAGQGVFGVRYEGQGAELLALGFVEPFITPTQGGDIGKVTVYVYGASAGRANAIRLTRVGSPSIHGTIALADSSKGILSAVLDLVGADRGPWDVVIEYPTRPADTITSGFTIVAGIAPTVSFGIYTRETLRAYQPASVNVNYLLLNDGNVDAPGDLHLSAPATLISFWKLYSPAPHSRAILSGSSGDFSVMLPVVVPAHGVAMVILVFGIPPPGPPPGYEIGISAVWYP